MVTWNKVSAKDPKILGCHCTEFSFQSFVHACIRRCLCQKLICKCYSKYFCILKIVWKFEAVSNQCNSACVC